MTSSDLPVRATDITDPSIPWQRAGGALAMAGAMAFLATALALQFLRRDLDWQDATLSQYLLGPYGLGLRTLYCVLAGAIVLLAAGLYASLQASARSAAPTLLLCGGALALSGVAIGDSWLPAIDPDFHQWFHHACAISAFLLVTTGMVLQAWRFRFDAHWRRHFPLAMGWSLACYALLWIHAFWPPAGEGWVQKLLIAAIVGAMALGGHWLWRAASPARAMDDARR
ncbi:DUF998 domain-containing protein [Pseudoxanthomonas sp. SL93]|uniref:DUF998 domain-containing protein n=1 Tax=Pseudoxanthomonas sp. SL93 TaxID=2995142 RepID=UPI0022710636|nr:DUF998 domain-containing protein [Pseudoxanthomonas sp. SL93]WAC64243.1 DUF998 domain-containing protein [Pseudoxanthomonas sp. SL93]